MTEPTNDTRELATQVTGGSVPQMTGARLPYYTAFQDRFGVDRQTWKFLTDVLYPSAEASESVAMALAYCQARKLDIMKKPVHIVPVWDKKRSRMVDSVWPSIAEVRITAMRTGLYAGRDETIFGPTITELLGGVEVTYPEWAQVTVYRIVGGHRCAFVGEKVRWKEYYAKAKKDTLAPNDMWRTKTFGQLAKCAEANALRIAFPEEDAGPTSDEMEGQEVATVIAPESAQTGSGVMARLSASAPSEEGFANADIDAAVSGEKPRRTRTKKTDAPEAEPVAEVVESTVDETAEIDPIGGGVVVDNESGEVLQEGGFTPEEPPAEPEAPTEEVIWGHAEKDEVYLHADFPALGDGRRVTFKNGERFSSVAQQGELKVYAEHPPEVAEESASEPEAETNNEVSGLPPEFAAYVQAIEDAPSWVNTKKAMQTFYTTDYFKGLSPEKQNQIRGDTWDVVNEATYSDKPDPAADVSAFRLWIEWIEDPDAITGTLRVLENEPAFTQKADDFKNAIRNAVDIRCRALQSTQQ